MSLREGNVLTDKADLCSHSEPAAVKNAMTV